MEMTTAQAKDLIVIQVRKYCQQAREVYGVHIYPTIKFDLKGTTAGTANSRDCVLRFNLGALNVENGWDHLYNDTVPHEVAHLVQYSNTNWPQGRKANPPHGDYWKKVMNVFGVKAERCHSLDLPKARQQRKWTYSCSCKEWELSTMRHNKMQRGTARYSCPTCKTPLRPAHIKQVQEHRGAFSSLRGSL